MLKLLHSDTTDCHALNSLHGVLQTASSKLNALLRLRIAKIFPFRYQRWPWTKQSSLDFSNNIFKPIFSFEQKIWWESSRQNGDLALLKSLPSDIKDGHPLNSRLDILHKTPSSKPYVIMSRNLIGLVRQNRDLEMLLSFHSDTKDGHALNSLLGLFHTTSSKPCITLSRK